jgi:hypothetical protein
VIVISWVATPVPQIEIFDVLADVVVFAAQVTAIVPLLLPDAGLTVTQVAEGETFQEVLEVIVKVVLPPPATKLMLLVESVRNREFPDWETVTV